MIDHEILSSRRMDDDTTEETLRSPFDADIDRLIFCDAFRRLQDKTQVHGPSGNDYVRSRLTHSMEVSRVGRQLGALFGQHVLTRAPQLANGRTPADFGQAVAAACLMHDIGNPPFGHTGEDAISSYFERSQTGRTLLADIGTQMAEEITRFEGNAQGLRVVTRLQGWRADSGLNLTAAVLAAQCKYPFAAGSERARQKRGKYNYFETEQAIVTSVAAATGMRPHAQGGWHRHPLAYLVEAADDACYRIVDIEDAFVMKILAFREAEELLMSVAGHGGSDYRDIGSDVKKINRLRSRAIAQLISELDGTIAGSLGQLITGEHDGDLILQGRAAEPLAIIASISRSRIYSSPERIRNDLAAHTAIAILLEAYLVAFLERERGNPSAQARSILSAFPHAAKVGLDKESYVRAVLDYVSGMTDGFAIEKSALFPDFSPTATFAA